MSPICINKEKEYRFTYSICTLVTRKEEYVEMVDSFIKAGFDEVRCEYLYIDNSVATNADAFKGLNRFLLEGQGKYIILCHQDILLHDKVFDDLAQQIKLIDSVDSNWAILANAGGINLKHVAMHLTQNSGNRLLENILPLKAITVDENFMVIKRSANLALSADLRGFHMYGTDICLIADILGYSSYIVDFNLTHKSDGNADASFYLLKKQLMHKYRRALRGRFISTTITRLYLSGSKSNFYLFNTPVIMFLVRQYYKFFKGKKLYKPVNYDIAKRNT